MCDEIRSLTPCFPSSRSTSSAVYSPLTWGTLIVISTSVCSFSSRIRFITIAVKSGAGFLDCGSAGGVCVAMRVYAGISSLERCQ
jgi:hypothetical protein